MAGLLSVGYFLASLIFGFILLLLWLRVALRYFRVSALHPMGHMVYRLTNPLFSPLETLLYAGKRLPRYDIVALVAIVLVTCCKILALCWLSYQRILPLFWLPVFVVADLVVQPCNFLFYALLIRILLSWVNPQWQQHPAADLLKLITNPLLILGRRIVSNNSGFDFGPLIVLVLLKVIVLFISASLPLPLL